MGLADRDVGIRIGRRFASWWYVNTSLVSVAAALPIDTNIEIFAGVNDIGQGHGRCHEVCRLCDVSL